MNYLIPIISSICFHFGGRDQFPWCVMNQKLWRWLMGIPIALILLPYIGWIKALCIVATYFLATNVSSYGESHIFRKWFGRNGCWLIYGLLFGLASLPALSPILALVQGMVGSVSFFILMKWSNDGFNGHKFNHKLVELGFGFLGTIMYWFQPW